MVLEVSWRSDLKEICTRLFFILQHLWHIKRKKILFNFLKLHLSADSIYTKTEFRLPEPSLKVFKKSKLIIIYPIFVELF